MKRLVIVGASYRGFTMFADKIFNNHKDEAKIVAVCDPNPVRSEYYRAKTFNDMRVYTDFELMLENEKPDGVIVATVDCYHHEYIIKALELGYDVYSEKPMTIDEEKCLAIREAERRSGKKVTVTFNCRFMPYYAKIKELVSSGVIGRPLAINYIYSLNTTHGGEYFMRWHRMMKNSGGMMVHKSTHHFDIANWLFDDEPISVSAQGSRQFFGNDDRPHGDRCSTCKYTDKCEAYTDYSTDEKIKALYFDAEHIDGYVRDHCVFKPDTDIYDTMSVSVAYEKGGILTYSLNMYDAREGYTINILGEKGTIEGSSYFEGDEYKLIVRYFDGRVEEVTFPKGVGTHAGGDDRLIDMLFGKGGEDALGQCADSFDGVKSAMIGIAANKSMKEGGRVDLKASLEKMR